MTKIDEHHNQKSSAKRRGQDEADRFGANGVAKAAAVVLRSCVRYIRQPDNGTCSAAG